MQDPKKLFISPKSQTTANFPFSHHAFPCGNRYAWSLRKSLCFDGPGCLLPSITSTMRRSMEKLTGTKSGHFGREREGVTG